MSGLANGEVTFSFGENWQSFLNSISSDSCDSAEEDIRSWLGAENVTDKTVLDIGSGSGIHSLAFLRSGAKSIVSFDYDPRSVEATRSVWEKAGQPSNWKVLHGSILDEHFIKSVSPADGFDIVYSWGVLHHTGNLWKAVENSLIPIKAGGWYWIGLYAKGFRYHRDLKLKQKYNRAGKLRKTTMVFAHMLKLWLSRFRVFAGHVYRGRFGRLKGLLVWNPKWQRGMNAYHDTVDWLGGLPYEVASVDEVISATRPEKLVLEKIHTGPDGDINVYLFRVPEAVSFQR